MTATVHSDLTLNANMKKKHPSLFCYSSDDVSHWCRTSLKDHISRFLTGCVQHANVFKVSVYSQHSMVSTLFPPHHKINHIISKLRYKKMFNRKLSVYFCL